MYTALITSSRGVPLIYVKTFVPYADTDTPIADGTAIGTSGNGIRVLFQIVRRTHPADVPSPYLSTAAKHSQDMLNALREALLGRPWMPPHPSTA